MDGGNLTAVRPDCLDRKEPCAYAIYHRAGAARQLCRGRAPALCTARGLPADPLAEQYLRDLKLLGGECMPDQRQKPEYMTHLNSREMVYKTHPRILLRGKLDTLESEILLVMVGCGETWRALLQDALMLVRQVLAADVKDAPLPPWKLGGMDAEEVHRGSHHPEAFGLSGHLLPAPEQGLLAAQMNRLRAVCREAELAGHRGLAGWRSVASRGLYPGAEPAFQLFLSSAAARRDGRRGE